MGFGISPVPTADPSVTASGYFIYKAQGSTIVTGSVLLTNPGSAPVTIQLAAVDALTAQTGGSAFATSEVTPTGVATWLTFAESSVTLPAGRQKPVDFTVRVPETVRPGQYLAGISAFVPSVDSTPGAEPGGSGMGASVTLQMRYVIGVQVDVEGAWTPSLTIDAVALIEQPAGPFIGVHMKNDGDVFHKPSGTIVLTDTTGKRVLEQRIDMGTFVTGTDVTYPVHWSGELAAGIYHVRVSLDYAENRNATYESQLEVGLTNAVQGGVNNGGATQVPGTIGSSNPVAVSPQALAAAQVQEGPSMWLWVLVGMGTLALAVAALLTLNRRNMGKMRRLHVQRKER
jgi:hypothetical protein